MNARDRKRSLLLVALVFALGVAVPKIVGAPVGDRARLAGLARNATQTDAPHRGASHDLAPSERAVLPGLAPAPVTTPESDLAFAG